MPSGIFHQVGISFLDVSGGGIKEKNNIHVVGFGSSACPRDSFFR
jgi:hypothetical protein